MDFNRVLTTCTDHRFSHTHAVEALSHDFDGVLQLFLLFKWVEAILSRFVDHQRHADAALEVEAEAELALRLAQNMFE